MQKRATNHMARKRGRRAARKQRASEERRAIGARDDVPLTSRPATRAIITLVGGTLLKGLVVPLLSRLANRIPIGGIAPLVRALCMRMFDRNELPP